METAQNEKKNHRCERCGYETPVKDTLIRHLKRVKPCQALFCNKSQEELVDALIKKYDVAAPTCKWCNKQFTHKSNLYAHYKVCKTVNCSETHDNTNVEIPPSMNTILEQMKKQIESQQHKISQLEEEIRTKPLQPTIIYNTNIQNLQQNNTLNINLKSYGKESLEHISNEMLTEFLKNRDILELVKTIHFNPEVPENHNVKRITTSKDYYKNQFLATYGEDGTWVHTAKDHVLKGVINKGLNMMSSYFKDITNKENITEESVDFNGWLLKTNCNPKQIMKDVFALTLEDKYVLGT